MILAGDIGGTKTVLALFEQEAHGLRCLAEKSYPSAAFSTLLDVIAAFRAEHPNMILQEACFGVAGPVIAGRSTLTNLSWVLDELEIAQALKLPRVRLLNDLTAAAFGMLYLRADEFVCLQGQPTLPGKGSIAIVAAGTGLGEAILYFDGHRYHAIPSEGGHTDFAPTTDKEVELWQYLRSTLGGHVSYERVLSGAGIAAIYAFLQDKDKAPTPQWLSAAIAMGDPNAAIAQAALAQRDPLSERALDLFCRILGAEAANLALKCLAGTVILGGGIPPKILPFLTRGAFLDGFTAKGRFSPWTQGLTVLLAQNPKAPLLGAAHYFISDRIHRPESAS